MPLLKRRTTTTTDDGRPWCRYCHVAVTLDADGCCELGHRVMSPDDAATLPALADAAASDATSSHPGGREVDDPTREAGEDLDSLIAEAAQAQRPPEGQDVEADFPGEYRDGDDAARDLADELDSLWAPPSASAPTQALSEPREGAPTEALSAPPTEPLGSPADHAPTTRLDGGDDGGDDEHGDLGPDGLTDEEREAMHAPAGRQRGESALDDVLDFGDDRG